MHILLLGPNDEAAYFRVPRISQPAHETGPKGMPMINLFSNTVGIIRNIAMVPGKHREISCSLLAKPIICKPADVLQAAASFILCSAGPSLYTPDVQRLLPLPSVVPASGVKRHAMEAMPELAEAEFVPEDPAPNGVPHGEHVGTSVQAKRSSKRLAQRAGPLFMDMVAQASYLKAKKLGDAPPPPISSKQIQVLGQGCKLEKKKLDALKKASTSVPDGKK